MFILFFNMIIHYFILFFILKGNTAYEKLCVRRCMKMINQEKIKKRKERKRQKRTTKKIF